MLSSQVWFGNEVWGQKDPVSLCATHREWLSCCDPYTLAKVHKCHLSPLAAYSRELQPLELTPSAPPSSRSLWGMVLNDSLGEKLEFIQLGPVFPKYLRSQSFTAREKSSTPVGTPQVWKDRFKKCREATHVAPVLGVI